MQEPLACAGQERRRPPGGLRPRHGLWHKWQTAPNSGWFDWHSLGGILTSNITVGTNAGGRLEVFVRGTDNALWHKWQTRPFLTEESTGASGAASMTGEGGDTAGALEQTVDMPAGTMEESVTTNHLQD